MSAFFKPLSSEKQPSFTGGFSSVREPYTSMLFPASHAGQLMLLSLIPAYYFISLALSYKIKQTKQMAAATAAAEQSLGVKDLRDTRIHLSACMRAKTTNPRQSGQGGSSYSWLATCFMIREQSIFQPLNSSPSFSSWLWTLLFIPYLYS